MGKRRTRTATTSKGERRSNVAGVREARQGRSLLDKELMKMDAWKKGKNPWLTVPNPTKGTNQPYIKVRANSYWGDPRKPFNIYRGKESE